MPTFFKETESLDEAGADWEVCGGGSLWLCHGAGFASQIRDIRDIFLFTALSPFGA